jgi:hypothetical protein
VTRGSYGPWGSLQSPKVSQSFVDRDYSHYVKDDDDEVTTTTDVHNKDIHNDNGEFSGHEHHRNWTVNPDSSVTVTTNFGNNLFAGGAPSGPKGQATQGEHTPGTIDVGIAAAAATNLLPGGNQLSALGNLLSPVAGAIAALGHVSDDGTGYP